jgi:hypothetical protein
LRTAGATETGAGGCWAEIAAGASASEAVQNASRRAGRMAEIVSPEARDADRKTPERGELFSFHGFERRE